MISFVKNIWLTGRQELGIVNFFPPCDAANSNVMACADSYADRILFIDKPTLRLGRMRSETYPQQALLVVKRRTGQEIA
jgi:hypothetical protein